LDPIERTNLALSAGAAALSLAFAPPAFAASLVAGAALESVNFRGLRRSAVLFLEGAGSGGFSALAVLRLALLAGGIALGLWAGAHPIAFAMGLSLIVPAALIEAWRHRPPVVPDAPALAADDPTWERWNPWLARESEAGDEEDGG
jgi:hypothetical protein